MKKSFLVAGLAFGDEGKGSVVDYLVRKHKAGLVVRYNGGAQAAHNVVTPDGRHHTFSQFGSGTFVPGVRTHLSRFTILNPLNMTNEEQHLRELGIQDAWDRTTVEDKALIITPYQQALNRLTEWSRGKDKHGTCGQGIGQTRSDHLEYGDNVLFAGDLGLAKYKLVKEKLLFLREMCREKAKKLTNVPDTVEVRHQMRRLYPPDESWVDDYVEIFLRWPVQVVGKDQPYDAHTVVFEGAQGVLLDETHGMAPYNTWTDCTFNNAKELLNDRKYVGVVEKVGVVRSYMTRHGQGPLSTEDEDLKLPELHNEESGWQGKFRFGKLDPEAVRHSIQILGGVNWIAMNHLDQRPLSQDRIDYLNEYWNAEIRLFGYGPTANDKTINYAGGSEKEECAS